MIRSLLSRLLSRHTQPLRSELADAQRLARALQAELTHEAEARRVLEQDARNDSAELASIRGELNRQSRVPVPADRRRAVLLAIKACGPAKAETIAACAVHEPALKSLSLSSITRLVSTLAHEGYAVSDGKRPARYRLTEAGEADLSARPMSTDEQLAAMGWRRSGKANDECAVDIRTGAIRISNGWGPGWIPAGHWTAGSMGPEGQWDTFEEAVAAAYAGLAPMAVAS